MYRMDLGGSYRISSLGLPTESGLVGSMHMDSFLQELWDKDPSLLATIGSLTASFQAGPASEAGPSSAVNDPTKPPNAENADLHAAAMGFCGDEHRELSRAMPLTSRSTTDGHRVIASTGFAVPADYSGKTVDEVWNAIHVSSQAPPSYTDLPVGSFLNHLGVRNIDNPEGPHPIHQQQRQQLRQGQHPRMEQQRPGHDATGLHQQPPLELGDGLSRGLDPSNINGRAHQQQSQQELEVEVARQHEHRVVLQHLAQQQQVGPGEGEEPYSQQVYYHQLAAQKYQQQHQQREMAALQMQQQPSPVYKEAYCSMEQGHPEHGNSISSLLSKDRLYPEGRLLRQPINASVQSMQSQVSVGREVTVSDASMQQGGLAVSATPTFSSNHQGRGTESKALSAEANNGMVSSGCVHVASSSTNAARLHHAMPSPSQPMATGHFQAMTPAAAANEAARNMQKQQQQQQQQQQLAVGQQQSQQELQHLEQLPPPQPGRLQPHLLPASLILESPSGPSTDATNVPPHTSSCQQYSPVPSTARAVAPTVEAATAARAARQRKRKVGADEARGAPLAEQRMVKNRESAARSRQRKQAYTTELEEQVESLKTQNRELRERVIKACPALDAQAVRALEMECKPIRRTRTDPY